MNHAGSAVDDPGAVPADVIWLSLLMPVHGVEPYLRDFLDALVPQLDAGVELIFLDDASPDGCHLILEQLRLELGSQVINLQHANNQGVSVSRNALLAAAKGTYVWFVDPDDVIEAGVISRLRALVERDGPDWVQCDFRSFDDALNKKQRRIRSVKTFHGPSNRLVSDPDLLLRGLMESGQFHPWSKVIRRAVWPVDLRFPEGRIFEDLTVFSRLPLSVTNFIHVSESWIRYRQRPGSGLSGVSSKSLTDWMMALSGYPADLAKASFRVTDATEFAVANFTAQTFIRIARKQSKVKDGEKSKGADLLKFHWNRTRPWGQMRMVFECLRHGWWWRSLQLAYYFGIRR